MIIYKSDFHFLIEILLILICVFSSGICLYFFITFLQKIRKIGLIENQELSGSPSDLVSIIIPACNQEDTITHSVESLLKQEYKNLQIILINDRSNDSTGKLMHNLSKFDNRIEVIEIKKLPKGWLGKPHAMHIGLGKAIGEYLLLTDADTQFGPKAITMAVHLCNKRNADHLVIKDNPIKGSFQQQIVISTLSILLIAKWILPRKPSPVKNIPIGFGVFNFLRTSSFKKTGGFVPLKMEILDDIAIGYQMNKFNYQTLFYLTHSEISRYWYTGVKDAFKGLEKNLFSLTSNFSYSKMIGINILLILVIAGPWLSFLFPVLHYLYFLSGIVLICFVIFSFLVGKYLSLSQYSILFFPFGLVFLFVALINSSWKFYIQKGIIWRDTYYPAKDLINGRII